MSDLFDKITNIGKYYSKKVEIYTSYVLKYIYIIEVVKSEQKYDYNNYYFICSSFIFNYYSYCL